MKIFASLAMSLVLGMAVACSQMDPNRTSSSNPNAVHTAVGGPLQVPANIGTQNVRGLHVP